MSDGPHRSLPLRRAWKQVCEIADCGAHGFDEVAERIAPALAADARGEITEALIRRLRGILSPEQAVLIDDSRERVAALRSTAVSAMEADLVDAVSDALRDGRTGLGALVAGAQATLEDRGHAAIHAVVEHYLRRVPDARAAQVGKRLLDALAHAREGVSALAAGLASGTLRTAIPAVPDRSGLDDGPALP
ncbi:hypothetical protein [Brevundimonas balnearis]|uniref:Uncharacterized protein n=1 Tax=Brevundimonas balnearis TaxID=1572858 RepID=A0ABV6R501_9CAUL